MIDIGLASGPTAQMSNYGSDATRRSILTRWLRDDGRRHGVYNRGRLSVYFYRCHTCDPSAAWHVNTKRLARSLFARGPVWPMIAHVMRTSSNVDGTLTGLHLSLRCNWQASHVSMLWTASLRMRNRIAVNVMTQPFFKWSLVRCPLGTIRRRKEFPATF